MLIVRNGINWNKDPISLPYSWILFWISTKLENSLKDSSIEYVMGMGLLETHTNKKNASRNIRIALVDQIKGSSEWARTTNLPDRGVIPICIQILDRV
jgi:hypothetical protein